MDVLIDSIYEIVKDYHCDRTNPMTRDRVETWIFQFEELDREFILTEFLHLLNRGIYISKERGKEILWNGLCLIAKDEKYTSIESFFRSTQFLKLQDDHKSQSILLVLLDALLSEKLGLRISDCGTLAPKYYIYIDDILATGGSYLKYISPFLNSNNNVDKLSKNQFKLISLFFCTHTWGEFNARYILKMKNSKDGFMNNKLFPIYSSFELENNIKNHNQKLNIAYLSTALKTKETDEYIFNLSLADRNYARAYRPLNNPNIELFFSNAVNRIRFESILFHKGLELLSQSAELKHNHRPLGMTNPTNQTFGTGTLFFTWTNISNTCPLVFWWEGHNWQGLFPLKNRGL